MIIIESKRKKPENIRKQYPDAIIADVTSQAADGLVKLSPFYPHGGIPVPFTEDMTAMRYDINYGLTHYWNWRDRNTLQRLLCMEESLAPSMDLKPNWCF